jgi:hypothetical protein
MRHPPEIPDGIEIGFRVTSSLALTEPAAQTAPMASFTKVLVLDNEMQAQLMDGILTEREIPHFIRSYDDLAYGGIFQSQKGWGQLEAPEDLHDEVRAIFEDLMSDE